MARYLEAFRPAADWRRSRSRRLSRFLLRDLGVSGVVERRGKRACKSFVLYVRFRVNFPSRTLTAGVATIQSPLAPSCQRNAAPTALAVCNLVLHATPTYTGAPLAGIILFREAHRAEYLAAAVTCRCRVNAIPVQQFNSLLRGDVRALGEITEHARNLHPVEKRVPAHARARVRYPLTGFF